MSQPTLKRDRTETCGNQIIHIRGDSDTKLDDLFKVLDNHPPGILSMKERKLPPSFFHQRLDKGTEPRIQSPLITHAKTKSAPEALVSQAMGAKGIIVVPFKHEMDGDAMDVDFSNFTDSSTCAMDQSSGGEVGGNDLGALPLGWEEGVDPSGNIYYINHVERTTTWQDPRVKTAHHQHQAKGKNQIQFQNVQGQQPKGSFTNEQMILLELQQLRMKNETIMKEKNKICQQEQLLMALLNQATTKGGAGETIDPQIRFISNQEVHARQNSSDSGFGGMNASFGVALQPVSYNEVTSTNSPNPAHPPPLTNQQLLDSFGTNFDLDDSGMVDVSQLQPSITEEVYRQAFSEVDNQKFNSLVWL